MLRSLGGKKPKTKAKDEDIIPNNATIHIPIFPKGILYALFTFGLFFVPLITGMSGNIGIQPSTVLVRSMALGFLTPGKWREAIFKELLLGLFNACFFGLLCGVLIYLLDFADLAGLATNPISIGIIVSMGLFGACLTGSLLGALSPFFFSRIGIDPAVASGPIITAINDFLSMSIYFLIAIGISSLIF